MKIIKILFGVFMIKIDEIALNYLYKNNLIVVISLVNVHLC